MSRKIAALLIVIALLSCASDAARRRAVAVPADAALEDLEQRTFRWFWDTADPGTHLVPDRWPTQSFSSIAAVGFGLTAYGIGAERGYVSRDDAAARTLATLQFFLNAPTGPASTGMTGYKGFYYHFLDMKTGARFKDVELSTIDTTLLLSGVLFAESYFDRDNPTEQAIRDAAETLYRNADWTFFLEHPPLVSMGWTPEKGLHNFDWHGYNEAMILYILALGSPTHPIDPAAWSAWCSTYKWETWYGQTYVTFPPLFGHQFSEIWIDFRGIQDPFMREHGIDYFENSRRAALSQHAYAVANPGGWRGYGENMWGLSACDGPLDGTLTIAGRERKFITYGARGTAPAWTNDDGTITPMAATASIVFAPEIARPAVAEMRSRFGDHLYQQYGFLDAFNETIDFDTPVKMGHVVPGVGWFDGDYLGIDQGPIVCMLENYRTGLVWNTMRKNPHIVQGLKRAGFTGGWLDAAGARSSTPATLVGAHN